MTDEMIVIDEKLLSINLNIDGENIEFISGKYIKERIKKLEELSITRNGVGLDWKIEALKELLE